MTSPPEAADFHDPGPAFRPGAFWFWHRIPTTDEIATQLADMHRKGLSRVMIQARPALPIAEYLSPAYLAAYREAAMAAGRLGLRLTIYDEYGWMSGHGGGRTVVGTDHLRERHLFWTTAPADRGRTRLTISGIHSDFLDFLGKTGQDWIYEGGAPRWGDWQAVLVLGRTRDGAVRRVEEPVAIRATGPTSAEIIVEHGAPLGHGSTLTVFAAARCLTSRMVNYLLPETAERFAARVYAPLAEAAGKAADGFFFDHPYAGFYRWAEHHGPVGNSLLWDAALLDGRAPEAETFLALIDGEDDASRARRARFLDHYARTLHAAFFGTLSRWTTARGLGFTGHELLTHVGAWGLNDGLTGFDPRSMPGVDYFGIDGYRTSTAVDSANFGPQLSAKMGDSVARAHGRRRCMVEQYATGRETGAPGLAGQWGLGAATFRAQAMRTILAGGRQIVLHAVNVTDGAPGDGLFSARFDFAPAYNFLPWWDDAGAIFAEIARLSAFIEGGDPIAAVALFYPHATALAEGPSGDYGTQFGCWAEALARAGIGHVVIDESQLPARICGVDRPDVLILPAVSFLRDAASREAIAAFCRTGGRVIATGPLPRMTLAGTVLRPLPRAGLTHLPVAPAGTISSLVADLPRPSPDLRFARGEGWGLLLASPNGWRLAALNDSALPQALSLTLPSAGFAIERWDCATGARAPLPLAATGARAELLLASGELLCLTVEPSAIALPSRPHEMPNLPAAVPLASGWTLAIGGAAPRPVEVTRGWEVQGYPDFAGTGVYSCRISLPPIADALRWHLVLPGLHETATLHIDGALAGTIWAGQPAIALPRATAPIRIDLHVRNSAANRYYSGTTFWDGTPHASGLTAPPVLAARPANPSDT